MGRHSSGRSGPFFRSFFGWLLPWALIATVVAVGAWMALDYSQRDGAEPVAQAQASTDQDQDEEPVAEATPTEETVTPTPEESPNKEPRKQKDKSVELITEGVSVQVLNGTNDPAAGEAMAEKLTGLGYQVVTVETTSEPYKETTVFWSFPDAQDAAKALAARFGWESDLKPGNLAATVSLHVVVGRDFSF